MDNSSDSLSHDAESQVLINKKAIKDKQENSIETEARWINNNGEEVTEVFGFNENAELVNARAAMFGFLMLLITELVFNGDPVTRSIFGIN